MFISVLSMVIDCSNMCYHVLTICYIVVIDLLIDCLIDLLIYVLTICWTTVYILFDRCVCRFVDRFVSRFVDRCSHTVYRFVDQFVWSICWSMFWSICLIRLCFVREICYIVVAQTVRADNDFKRRIRFWQREGPANASSTEKWSVPVDMIIRVGVVVAVVVVISSSNSNSS